MVIELDSVTKTYGNHNVLDDLDLSVQDGSLVIITGGNGSGKTTILHLVAGLRQRDGGQVRLHDEPITKFGRTRRHSRILPQKIAFQANATPAETVQFYRNTRSAPVRLESPLDDVGLTDKRDAYIKNLSGGMVQRLGLGVALMHETPVLLLDEPTNNLDPDWRGWLRDQVRRERELGHAILISTQHPDHWDEPVDRRFHLEEGTLERRSSDETDGEAT